MIKIIALLIMSIVALFMGMHFFNAAKLAIHEIEGLICFNMAAIFLVGTFILDALHKKNKTPIE